MAGVLASCNALEPIFEEVSDKILPSESMSQSVIVDTISEVDPQDSMSVSPTVIVT